MGMNLFFLNSSFLKEYRNITKARSVEHRMSMLMTVMVFPPIGTKHNSEHILFKKWKKGFNIFKAKNYVSNKMCTALCKYILIMV